jgi:hypothetical protein
VKGVATVVSRHAVMDGQWGDSHKEAQEGTKMGNSSRGRWNQLSILDRFGWTWLHRRMARPIRIECPGAMCHVMARGNERKAKFRDDQDRHMWLKTLAEAVERTSDRNKDPKAKMERLRCELSKTSRNES